MSRTTRRKSGNRWWRDLHRSKWNFTCGGQSRFFFLGSSRIRQLEVDTPEKVEAEIQGHILNYEKKDGHYNSRTKSLKWHSTMLVRSSNRMQIRKIMKTGEYDRYDPTHDHLKKKLIWCYD